MGTKVIAVCLLLLTATREAENSNLMFKKAVEGLEKAFRDESTIVAWPFGYDSFSVQDQQVTDNGYSHGLFDSSPSIITVESVVINGETLAEPVEIRNKVIITQDFIVLDESSTQRVNLVNVTLIAKLVLLNSAEDLSDCLIISEYVKILASAVYKLTVVSKLSLFAVNSRWSQSLIISDDLEISDSALKTSGLAEVESSVFIAVRLRFLTGHSTSSSLTIENNLFLFHSVTLEGSNCIYKTSWFLGERLSIKMFKTIDASPSAFLDNSFYLKEQPTQDVGDVGVNPVVIESFNLAKKLMDISSYVLSLLITAIGDDSAVALKLDPLVTLILRSENTEDVERVPLKIIESNNNNQDGNQDLRSFESLGVQVLWSVGEFWLGVSTLLSGVCPAMRRTRAFDKRYHRLNYEHDHQSIYRLNATLQFSSPFFDTVNRHLSQLIVTTPANHCTNLGLASLVNLQDIKPYFGATYRAQDINLDPEKTLIIFKEINYFSNKNFQLQDKTLIGHKVNFDFGLLGTDNLTFYNVTVIAEKVRFRSFQSTLSAQFCLIVADDVVFELLNDQSHVALDLCTIIAKNVWLKSREHASVPLKPFISVNFLNSTLVAQNVEITATYVNFVSLIMAANKLHFNFSSWLLRDCVIIAETAVLSQFGWYSREHRKIQSTRLFAKSLSATNFAADNQDNVLVADELVFLCANGSKTSFASVSKTSAAFHLHNFCSTNRANGVAPVNFANALSHVDDFLFDAIESSAKSILSFKNNLSEDSINLQDHLFDLFPAVQIAVFSEMKFCSAGMSQSISDLEPMQTSDLFSHINVPFIVSLSSETKHRIATAISATGENSKACKNRKKQCPVTRREHPTTTTTSQTDNIEPTENVPAEYVAPAVESAIESVAPKPDEAVYATTSQSQPSLTAGSENNAEADNTENNQSEEILILALTTSVKAEHDDSTTSPTVLQSTIDADFESAEADNTEKSQKENIEKLENISDESVQDKSTPASLQFTRAVITETVSELSTSFLESSVAVSTEDVEIADSENVPDDKSESTAAMVTNSDGGNNHAQDFEEASKFIAETTTVVVGDGGNDKSGPSKGSTSNQIFLLVLLICLIFVISLVTATLSVRQIVNPFKRYQPHATAAVEPDQTCNVSPISANAPSIVVADAADQASDFYFTLPKVSSSELVATYEIDEFFAK